MGEGESRVFVVMVKLKRLLSDKEVHVFAVIVREGQKHRKAVYRHFIVRVCDENHRNLPKIIVLC